MESASQLSDYTMISVIGRGTYAKVLLVRHNHSKQIYALKVIKKKYILERNQEQSIMTEKNILCNIQHPFLVSLKSCFQDERKLYFVLEYCPGGELFGLLAVKERLSQEQAKFYTAQIFLALETLHSRNIIYRDLKPENVLLDRQGYLKLTDFGLSKQLRGTEQTTMSICGTPQYLSPEMIRKTGHSKAVDWWCLGCIIYEMVTGFPPYHNQTRVELLESILYTPLTLPNVSPKLQDLLVRLLEKDPSKRIGTKSSAEIKNHPWFEKVNWKTLESKVIKAPFIPILNSEIDTSNFDEEFTNCSVESYSQGGHGMNQEDGKFHGFDFDG